MGGIADWFGPPKAIDPGKVQGYMHSDYTDKLGQMGDDMLDPNSSLNQGWKAQFNETAQDNTYTQNRIMNQNFSKNNMTNQSGIMEALKNQNVDKNLGQGEENFQNFALNQGKNAAGAYGQAQAGDMATGDAMASAYGQNITNTNNYNSGMASSVMGLAGPGLMMLSDPKFKRNMKQIGTVKTTKKRLPLYSFNYKGSNKQSIGFSADDVQKEFKSAVMKDRNGIKWINMNKLKEVIR